MRLLKLFIINFKYISFSKVRNLFFLNLAYFFKNTSSFSSKNILPAFISVEAANYCQLHCPECPVGNIKKATTKNKLFDILLLEKILKQLKNHTLHIILYFQGEPFLHPDLIKLIQKIHSEKIYCSTSTNGQSINKHNVKDIVLSGLDKLIVSVDGTTQATYEKYRVGGNLNKTLEVIKELVKCKNELKSLTPLIEIQFLVLKTNEHQLKEMKKLAKQLKVDKLSFKTAQLYDFEHGNKLMPSQLKYSRYKKTKSGDYALKHKMKNKCWRMWSGAVVNVHGEILPCCFDKNSAYSVGNLYEGLFSEIWHNKKASDLRKSILENRKQYEMCRNCTS